MDKNKANKLTIPPVPTADGADHAIIKLKSTLIIVEKKKIFFISIKLEY